MQDDWLTPPGESAGYNYEVMIQYDHENDGACPSNASIANGKWNYGVTATNVMSTARRGTSVMVSRCRSHVFGGVSLERMRPGGVDAGTPGKTANQSSVSLNLKAMFQWLEQNDPPGETYPYVSVGSSVYALSNGFEISSTGGVPETFATYSYTVTATGAPST